MFDQWVDEHKEAIINAIIAQRRSQNDTRPDDAIRPGADLALRLLGQSLRGEANWKQASRAGTEQALAMGTPLQALAESSHGIYIAIGQVLQNKQPEQWHEWLYVLGDYMLTASQVVTQVLEAGLEEQVAKRTQEVTIFKTMAENSMDAIVMADLETGRLSYANRVAHEMYGYDYNRQEMMGQVGTNIWFEEDISLWTETIIPQAKAGGWSGEVRHKRKNGDMFDASIVIFPLHDDAGKLINIAATIRDVSGQKQAEAALRENEERFRRFSTVSVEGLLFYERGVIIDANAALATMLGLADVSEMIGKGVLEFIAPEVREATAKQMQLESLQPYETLILRKDGAVVSIETIGRSYEFQGRTVRVVSVRDITERKQAEAERERLQREIIEAQQRAIQELSTPVIPIMDRIIVMPLIGSIDSLRARDITRNLLAGISQHRAKVVILDVTGVGIMDTSIVNHLNKTIQAARLKGAQTIVTGVADAVAEAIVDSDIDWSGIITLSDLQTGLVTALGSLGVKLTK
jgi:PAS domain S-box-containing protein